MIREQRNINGRSLALAASILLHGLTLLALGVGTWQGSVPVSDELIVYLAMPSAAAERAHVPLSTPGKRTAAKPVQARPGSQAQPKPQLVKAQPAAEIMTLDEKPPSESVPSQKVEFSKQPEPVPAMVETALIGESIESAPETHPEAENGEVSTLTRNLKLETRSPAKTLLAFAGDPSALGMIAREALGPDLIEAEILSLPEPVYPVLSRKKGEEGRVLLEVTVSAQGEVRRAQVETSSSYSRLDNAALRAVQLAAFSPATEFGRPVESELKVAYRFKLEGRRYARPSSSQVPGFRFQVSG